MLEWRKSQKRLEGGTYMKDIFGKLIRANFRCGRMLSSRTHKDVRAFSAFSCS